MVLQMVALVLILLRIHSLLVIGVNQHHLLVNDGPNSPLPFLLCYQSHQGKLDVKHNNSSGSILHPLCIAISD